MARLLGSISIEKNLSREQIIFTRHYFEHGCLSAAAKAAGYAEDLHKELACHIRNPDSRINRFYQELCKDRVASTVISTERKRAKIWELIEWSTQLNDDGQLNNYKMALSCLDMLNKMDGDYQPLRIENKHDIQKATVNFNQNIPKIPKAKDITPIKMDEALEHHKEIPKDKKRVING